MTADDTDGAGSAIRVAGLAKSYGAAAVFEGLSFSVAPGTRLALIGPNGAGKSTLLRCLIGLVPPSGGEIEVLGERFGAALPAAQRARLRQQTGFVFQKHGLVARLSVLSNVCHGLLGAPGSWRGFAQSVAPASWRARAMEALDAVGLADRAMDRADALSGGQSQRVAIARALVRRPRLILADEPAASLDPAAGEAVMALFSDLARAHGITLVYTSHDMAHAVDYSDRVLALRARRIALDRPSAAVDAATLTEIFDG
ncbi:MAG: phosphonate ABC transporter ATP-binding protein [Paracoccaceae bacterium]